MNVPNWYKRSVRIWLFTGLPLLIIAIVYTIAAGGVSGDTALDLSYYRDTSLFEIIIVVGGVGSFLFAMGAPLFLYPFTLLRRRR